MSRLIKTLPPQAVTVIVMKFHHNSSTHDPFQLVGRGLFYTCSQGISEAYHTLSVRVYQPLTLCLRYGVKADTPTFSDLSASFPLFIYCVWITWTKATVSMVCLGVGGGGGGGANLTCLPDHRIRRPWSASSSCGGHRSDALCSCASAPSGDRSP